MCGSRCGRRRSRWVWGWTAELNRHVNCATSASGARELGAHRNRADRSYHSLCAGIVSRLPTFSTWPINMSEGDPTDRQLRQAKEALQEELAECNRELCRVRQELEQFIYAVSHDLREPLRMACSYLELIQRRYGNALNDDGREFLGYATDGAERLQAMLDGLLEYSRVTTRGQQFQPVDASTVLRRATASLERLVRETGASITCDVLPTVNADPDQLAVVLRNLLKNSLTFRSLESPRIHISARQEGNEWVFTVVDNGLGIDPRFHERVFVVFQQVHGREYGGVGVGLAIVKRIIERHGGRVWVDSQPGKGARFFFTLPAMGAESP